MARARGDHLFIVGADYHLGDLLWFTAVLATFRDAVKPAHVQVALPDRAISHILEGHPLIDDLILYEPKPWGAVVPPTDAARLVVHDLRPLPIAFAMLSQWQHRRPWLYGRDLWLEPRGQWLATYLRLGPMERTRPLLRVKEADRAAASGLPQRYVLLAPHIGAFRLPLLDRLWKRVKGWPSERWQELASRLRAAGYEPITLGAAGQPAVEGTRGLIGLPLRQVVGVVERASALVTVESGLWYIAAALARPVVIVPWWLPLGIDWVAPMRVPHRLVRHSEATVDTVMRRLGEVLGPDS